MKIAVLTVMAALALAGCSRVSDSAETSTAQPAPHDAALERITADFGATILVDQQVIADGVSAIDALRATTAVETAYGGGFVAGMFDRHSDASGKRDWFFFVNGIAPGVGAGDYTVRRGDTIWWDYRPWGGGPSIPAVVGSWPEPFVHGYPQAPRTVRADAPLAAALGSAGARISDRQSPWRVIVGSTTALVARDDAWRRAMDDPAAAGLAVRITPEGIRCLADDGSGMVPVPQGRAVAALVPTGATTEQGGAVFAVAGIDDRSAQAAAASIAREPAILTGRVAVVFDGDGVPVAAPGRSTP